MSLKIMLVHLLTNYKFSTTLKWDDIKIAIDTHSHITVPKLVSIKERHFFD